MGSPLMKKALGARIARLSCFCALFAAALAAGVVTTRAEVIEQVLLKVNGEIFTKTDLETRQAQALRQLGDQSSDRKTDAELRKMIDDITPQLLVNVVDELLLIQRGKELGFSMSDEQFKGI